MIDRRQQQRQTAGKARDYLKAREALKGKGPNGTIGSRTATGEQVTTYVYGTTTSDSEVASHSLLRAIIYPDSDDTVSYSLGNPSLANGTDSTYDRIEMTYNRLGELTERKD